MPARIAGLAGLAAAASLATAPVVVWHFGRLSIAGLALNVVAVPLAAPIVILALAGLAAGAVVPAAGVLLAWVAGLGAWTLLLAARAAAAIPGAAVDLPPATAPVFIALALAPLALWARDPPGRLHAGGAGDPLAPGGGARAGRRGRRVAAHPSRATTTVAGRRRLSRCSTSARATRSCCGAPTGPPRCSTPARPARPAPVVAALRRAGVRRLDLLVLTHDSLDHVGGAIDILERFPVGVVLHPPDPVDGWLPAARAAVAGARARGVPVRLVRAGSRLRLGRWRLRVLSPAGARPVGADPNPYSLVTLARVGSLRRHC